MFISSAPLLSILVVIGLSSGINYLKIFPFLSFIELLVIGVFILSMITSITSLFEYIKEKKKEKKGLLEIETKKEE